MNSYWEKIYWDCKQHNKEKIDVVDHLVLPQMDLFYYYYYQLPKANPTVYHSKMNDLNSNPLSDQYNNFE